MLDLVRSTVSSLLVFYASIAFSDGSKIVGGIPAPLRLFPEVAYFPTDKPDCAAVIISDRIAITAAHCLPRERQTNVSIKMVHQGEKEKFKCTASPYYEVSFHDLAVCKAENSLEGPFAILPQYSPELDQRVLLTGFGCSSLTGPRDRELTFRIGRLRVRYTTGELHDLQFATESEIHLCQGDSGAPIFKTRITSRSREVYGINSRTDLISKSYFTDLAHPLSQQVIEQLSE